MARTFDGSDDFLVSSAQVSASVDDFTMAVWAYWTGSAGISAIYNGSTPRYGLHIGFGGDWEAGLPGVADISTGIAPVNGAWKLVAIRRSSGTTKGIIHGVEGSGSDNRAPGGTPDNLYVGARNGVNVWHGRLAHAMFWNRAVPTADLLDMATNLKSPLYYSTGLVGYWPIAGTDSPEPATTGSATLTVTGTTQSDGPAIVDPVTGTQYMNDQMEAFLQDYYTSSAPLSSLLVTYLNENPDGLSDYTARFQKLITDAGAA